MADPSDPFPRDPLRERRARDERLDDPVLSALIRGDVVRPGEERDGDG